MNNIETKSHRPALQLSSGVALTIVVISCLTVGLNFSALSASWRWDDASILLHISDYSVVSNFIHPATWQQFSPSNLTPWLALSYKLDLIIFGFEPFYFYLHQLVSLAACAYFLFALLRQWTGKSAAMYGSCLFLLGGPSLILAQQLMTRHYIEGLGFCLLSLLFFTMHLRIRKRSWLLVSSLFYLCAVVAKETYVPLLILLLFLPESDFRARIRAVTPHIAIAFAYTIWRGYMLNSVGGGYVDASEYFSTTYLREIFTTFSTFPQLLFGSYWLMASAAVTLLLIVYGAINRSGLWLLILVLSLIFIPLIPLVKFPGINVADRYLFLLWAAFCFFVAYVSHILLQYPWPAYRLAVRNAIYGLCSLVLLFGFLAGQSIKSSVEAVGNEFDAQAEFIWSNDEQVTFQPSTSLLQSYWFYNDLKEFKHNLLDGRTSPVAVIDPVLVENLPESLWRYEQSCRCMAQLTESISEVFGPHLAAIDSDQSLAMQFTYVAGYFSWRFGPYENGQYHVISSEFGVIQMPRSGNLRIDLEAEVEFYLRYTSPSGWTTYSDEMRIVESVNAERWERK